MYPENKVRLWLKREVDPVHNVIRWLQTYQGPKPSCREYSDGHYYIIVSDITMMSHMPHSIPNHLQLHCLSIACSGWHPKKHQSSALLVHCEGNPPVTGGFPSQRASNEKNFPCYDIFMVYMNVTKAASTLWLAHGLVTIQPQASIW